MKFGTKAIHQGVKADPNTGAIMTPIYQTSTYVQSAPGEHLGYDYSRAQNPTREVLENNIAALENAQYGACFSSGMAATDAILKLLKPGDEVIATNDLYGGTHRIFTQVYKDFGLDFHFLDTSNELFVEDAVNEKTRMLWIETPTNPALKITDIEKMAEIAQKNNLLLVVDNTFASPYLQKPLELGAHIALHSATKYLGGHSDVVLGAVACNDDQIAEQVHFLQKTCGGVPGPQDCFLVLRGIKTLHVRMPHHCHNGNVVAHYLRDHPRVRKVFWPGFEDSHNHDVAQRQMADYGGMVSFTLKVDRYEEALKVLQNTEIFALAESLGGVESLIGHPASMTHASIPKEDREAIGVTDSFMRLSVGIEHEDDLLLDLKNALDQLAES